MSPRFDRSYCLGCLLKGLGGFLEAYAGAERPASASSGVSGGTVVATLARLPASVCCGTGIASGGTLTAGIFLSVVLLCRGSAVIHGSVLSLYWLGLCSALAGDPVGVLRSAAGLVSCHDTSSSDIPAAHNKTMYRDSRFPRIRYKRSTDQAVVYLEATSAGELRAARPLSFATELISAKSTVSCSDTTARASKPFHYTVNYVRKLSVFAILAPGQLKPTATRQAVLWKTTSLQLLLRFCDQNFSCP